MDFPWLTMLVVVLPLTALIAAVIYLYFRRLYGPVFKAQDELIEELRERAKSVKE